jgi:hypothetical protein
MRAFGLASALGCAALALSAGSSKAAVGDLTYQGCISGETESAAACALIPSASSFGAFSGLSFLQGVIVSPDGTSVYAVAEDDDAIAAFARDPATGALTYQGCISGDTAAGPAPLGSGACTLLASATVSGDESGVDRVRALAMSPDGAHLYAVAHNDDALVHFSRDESSGALTFGGCLTGDSDVSPPCADVGGATAGGNASGLNQPYDLVVHEGSLYVLSQEDDSIVHFTRGFGGSLAYSTGDCFTGEVETGPASGGGSGACAASPTITAGGANSGFDKPRSVTMTTDGTSVYVAAPQDDSVARFDRAAGALTYQGCITGEEATGPNPPGTGACTPLPGPVGVESQGELTGINNPQSIAVSPDGASLYLASGNDTSVARFDRAAAGALTYRGCITGNVFIGPAPGGNGACAAAPVMTTGGFDTGLDNMRDVVVAPGGASVYASSAGDSAVVTFTRDGSGAIAVAGCTSGETETGACTQIPSSTSGGNNSGMGWVQALAPSQDGTSLYYIAQNDHAVGRFSIEQPPPPDEPPAEPDASPPDSTITGGPKKKTKKKTAEFAFNGTDARVVAGFQCSVDGAPFVPCSSPFTTKVKKGKHNFRVRAVDAAGNVDPTPASYDWKVKKKKKKKKGK